MPRSIKRMKGKLAGNTYSLRPILKTEDGKTFEFQTGHPDVNREMDYILYDWSKKYSNKIKIDTSRDKASMVTRETKDATIIETVSNVLEDIHAKLKDHSEIFTDRDREAISAFKKTLSKTLSDKSKKKKIYLSVDDLIRDTEGEDAVRIRELREFRDLKWKSATGEGLSPYEKKRLGELEKKYSDKPIMWPLLVVKNKKTGVVELVPVESKHIVKDILNKEAAASRFIDFDTVTGIDPFYHTLEKLLKIDVVGGGKEEREKLKQAYSEALKALTLYRFRDAISSRHYAGIIDIIRRRLGKEQFMDVLSYMSSSGDPYSKEVAEAVKTALKYIPKRRRMFRL